MHLLDATDVSLRLASPWSEQRLARSAILADGRDTGQIVTGEVLEAALQWKGCFLLFVTDAIPFEDSLRIYLFDAGWRLLDCARLGAMYSTGHFADLVLAPPDSLRFSFIGGIAWELQLLEHDALALPFCDPKGVARPFGLRRRFRLRGRPLPQA
ncbi:hypothetical protein [Massilia sp. MS-15]|uniref:hypothetical protein n=1 Tax=Massilia sp. MS-15 TaxID=2878200 RepID=UPI001CD79DAD|nr:hypothetical protein [Massilia sp. MS-15]MCA1248072.1 hypothetical protein [Massilia sp. MS-15]